jgi:RND superfamily putative drug exporter
VLFAGITVCIAMLGMFSLGLSFLNGVAIATSIVVAFTVLASLTLQPALLGFFGTKVLKRKQRKALKASKHSDTDESPLWGRWARWLQPRNVILSLAAIIFMLVLSSPFTHIRLGSSDSGSDPKTTTTRKAYDILAQGFGPGFNGPFQLVAKVDTPLQKQAFNNVLGQVAKTEGVVQTSPARRAG